MSCKQEPNPTGAKKLDCAMTGNVVLTNHNQNGLDYTCDCDAEVVSGTLTIEPGVSIQFSSGGGLVINNNAALVAEGTAAEPIVMQGNTSSTGAWLGLLVASNNALNILNHVQITSGGGRSLDMLVAGFTDNQFSAIHLVGRLKLNNTSITKSRGNGFTLHETGQIMEFSNNTIQQSTNYPILMYAGQLNNTALASCTFVSNTKNTIAIYSRSSNTVVSEAVNFIETPVAYHAYSSIFFQGNVTMAAGSLLTVGADLGLGVNGNGYLRINGNSSKPVYIKGESAVAGYWKGILVNSNNTNNVFDYLEVSDGGSSGLGLMPPLTNIAVGDVAAAKLALFNCKSLRSAGCQLAYSVSDATVNVSSPEITNTCTY